MNERSDEARCKSCDAPILWCTTGRGRRMPVDRKPVKGGEYFVEPVGDGLVVRRAQPNDSDSRRYTSHLDTCISGASKPTPKSSGGAKCPACGAKLRIAVDT